MRIINIAAVSIIALVGAAYATFQHVNRTRAEPIRELSKMMSVRHIVSEALTSYYQQHNNYPSSLSGLPLQTLRWGDEGSSVRDIEAWTYFSDGSGFTMTWTNARGTELYAGGITGQLYYSRDERQ